MSGNELAGNTSEAPAPEIVEAFAKQLFRSENPPDHLWDTKLFDQMGRSTEGLNVADEALKDAYRGRARDMLLNPG